MPVRPRDAASLVLLRGPAGAREVLMGRRRPRAAFIPDAYVFPGGRVDSDDARTPPLRPLTPATETDLTTKGACSQARAAAVATAAIRELWEETGLILGSEETGRLRPDHARLRYLGRAITPATSPIRFHARFLLAEATGAEGPLAGSGELLDLAWIPLHEALRLPVIDVTEFLLRWLQAADAPAGHPLYTYRAERPRVRYL